VIDFSTPEPVIVRQGKGDLKGFDVKESSSS